MPAPVSSFLGLQTTLRGLLAQQRALDVTSHNIANAGTAGYTRQEASMVAAATLQVGSSAIAGGAGAHLGQGVEVEAYRRMRDDFLDLQFRAQQMALGDKETTAESLSRVEETLAEPGDGGINALLTNFWDSWQDLSEHPNDGPTRQSLIEAAASLVTGLRDVDARLQALSNNLGQQYNDIVNGPQSPILAAGNEIASLNAAISAAVGAGRQPNDLLDRRDLLLDRLSELGQVSVSDPDGDGAVDVSFGGAGVQLVDGTTGTVTWPQALATPGGKLGALLSGQTAIAGYRADLNTFVSQLATSVNAIHNGGSGVNFFTGATAATITVAVNATTLRAATTGTAGANDIALAVNSLRNGAVDGAYASFVRKIGADAATAEQGRATAQGLFDAINDRRTGISGVSFDEEMSNMVRFQRGYQASARAMSTMDEMLETLINRTGRVGL